ncbi:unnamed protein product [Arabidopsis lyrata]|nr:unnamed protein product [Arabidopsis lyrata]
MTLLAVATYLLKRKADKKKSLLGNPKDSDESKVEVEEVDGKDSDLKDEGPVEWVSYWKPNVTNNLVDDFTRYPQHGVPPNIDPYLLVEPSTVNYYPTVFFNEFWLLRDKLILINETVSELPLNLEVSPISMTKWQLFQQIDQSFQIHRSYGSMLDVESDELKRVFLEGNPYLLGVTMLFRCFILYSTSLHSKNDIQFWNKNKSMEGLSAKLIFLCHNVFSFFSSKRLIYIVEWMEINGQLILYAFNMVFSKKFLGGWMSYLVRDLLQQQGVPHALQPAIVESVIDDNLEGIHKKLGACAKTEAHGYSRRQPVIWTPTENQIFVKEIGNALEKDFDVDAMSNLLKSWRESKDKLAALCTVICNQFIFQKDPPSVFMYTKKMAYLDPLVKGRNGGMLDLLHALEKFLKTHPQPRGLEDLLLDGFITTWYLSEKAILEWYEEGSKRDGNNARLFESVRHLVPEEPDYDIWAEDICIIEGSETVQDFCAGAAPGNPRDAIRPFSLLKKSGGYERSNGLRVLKPSMSTEATEIPDIPSSIPNVSWRSPLKMAIINSGIDCLS